KSYADMFSKGSKFYPPTISFTDSGLKDLSIIQINNNYKGHY
ncbi:16383_t:CDS:1, partial [Dentiscutata heterogama]